MKIIIVNLFLLISSLSLFGQGVNFEALTFNEALAKAKQENKLVFVDCYTAWCVPCRVMAENVFPQKEAGDFFNPKFVCVKFDMEKGEGLELSKKLKIKAYPTFFIIRPDGAIQHMIVGGGELEPFINKVERGLDKKTSFTYLNKLYEKGEMTKEQLMTYMVVLQDAGERAKSKEIGKKLDSVLTEKDKMKKEYWPILEKSVYGSDDFSLVLNNIAIFKKNVGGENVESYLYQNYSSTLNQLVSERPKDFSTRFTQIREELEKSYFEKREKLEVSLNFCEAIANEDIEKIINLISRGNVELWSHTGKRASELLVHRASIDQLKNVAALECQYITGNESEAKRKFLKEMFVDFNIAARTMTFEEAFEVAKQRRGRVFIDCYDSDSPVCRYMSDTVFRDEELKRVMNENFIYVKCDIKKQEGREVCKKFDVHVYPTFVVVNWKGGVRHKFTGIGDAEYFRTKLEDVFNGYTALECLEEFYNMGRRDKKLLTSYAEALASVKDSRAPGVVKELFRVLSDEERVSSRYWYIFAEKEYSPNGSDAEKFLLKNRTKFVEVQGLETVEQRLRDCQ